MIEPIIQYVPYIPQSTMAHASMVSFLSFAFMIVAIINIDKRGFMNFDVPMIAGGAILYSGYPMLQPFPYAIIGWIIIASLIYGYRVFLSWNSQKSGVFA